MIKSICIFFLFATFQLRAQCDSVIIINDLTISSDVLMSGTYVINGVFTVQSNTTVYVTPFESNGCGALKIYATSIVVNGTINGDYAGYPGGDGGDGATVVSSITGHEVSLSTCNDAGNHGKISVEGGKAGQNGEGPGGGNSGTNGITGSGPKQYCGSVGDEAGMIGGSGGAGGGAGGSYGGQGSNAAQGGAGSAVSTVSSVTLDSSYPVIGGQGGQGGASTQTYGTSTSRDIQLGSGGAGAGGGGRSYNTGGNGTKGGNGGGMIFLKATNSLSVNGTLTVKGENGTAGGHGGNGDATADCCSDGCSGCDERTFSAGAGAGAGSGAGSGGGIFLESESTATINGTLNVQGGNGGNSGTKGTGTSCTYNNLICGSHSITTGDGSIAAKGGAGGGGRIKIFLPECINGSISPDINTNGGTGFAAANNGTYEFACDYLGINSFDYAHNVSLYPNPADEVVYLKIDENYLVDFLNDQIEIYNAIGALQFRQPIENHTTTIDVTLLDPGFYSVRIKLNKTSSTKKLIIR